MSNTHVQFVLSSICLTAVAGLIGPSAVAQQVGPETCYVFNGNSPTGQAVPKSQFFSMVAGAAETGKCSYGKTLFGEGRFYFKNQTTGQVTRAGGDNVTEYDAQTLASQNGVQYYECTQLTCSNNPINLDKRIIEPTEVIASRAREAAQQITLDVLQDNLRDYFKMLSYAHQMKNQLAMYNDSLISSQAVSSVEYQRGNVDGEKKCVTSCETEGEAIGASHASYRARNKVDTLLNTAFDKGEKPAFEPVVVPDFQDDLMTLRSSNAYSQDIANYWNNAGSVYSTQLARLSPCGSASCSSFRGLSISTPSAIHSIIQLRQSNTNLMEYAGQVQGDVIFDLFAARSPSVRIDELAYKYFQDISNSAVYQKENENRQTFKKYFVEQVERIIASQWPVEVTKYFGYLPVAADASQMAQSVVSSLGYAYGFNTGYERNFAEPGRRGYSKVFAKSYVGAYGDRVKYYQTNAIFTDVKVSVSNKRHSNFYSPYDDVLLTIKGVSNKGFVEGEIFCELIGNDKMQSTPKKGFKIPAYTKSDKEIVVGKLGYLPGSKVSPDDEVQFAVTCGDDRIYGSVKVTWSETVVQFSRETTPQGIDALKGYVISYLNSAYRSQFEQYPWGNQPYRLDNLLSEFVQVYQGLSPSEKANLDRSKDQILLTSFGVEPKKTFFGKNINYKLHQRIKGHLSKIGWTPAAKK
jgi:hypothetical protein